MRKQIVISALLFWGVCFAGSLQAKQRKKVNVIMLVVDDWNDMISAFGNQQVKTPNIDKLCDRGVRFTNNHTAATYCTPSRTALMTGVAPWNSGCYADHPHHYNMPERKTMPALFKENGYKVLGGGKVYHHMPGYVDLKGYDEYFHWNPEQKKKGWGVFAWRDNPATPEKLPTSDFGRKVYKNFDIAPIPNEVEKDMADTKVCDWAIEQLQKNHNEPFFLSVGLYSPHKPNFAPQKYYDLYPIEEVQIPEIKEGDEKDLPVLVQKMIERKAKHTHNKLIQVNDGWRKAVQGYMASVSYADAQIGRVLKALKNSPYADNTIIVFWSDNGYHLGEKKCWAKHTLWERTTNVPLVWAGPGIAKGEEYKGVTSLLDIYPTLVDKCQLKNAQKLDGAVITEELHNPEDIKDRAVVTAGKKGDSFSVFTKDWHYINHQFGKGEELYRVADDSHEWTNLANEEKWTEVKEQLASQLPKNPSKPAVARKKLQLKFKGESFEWVKKPESENKQKQGKKGRKNKKHKR